MNANRIRWIILPLMAVALICVTANDALAKAKIRFFKNDDAVAANDFHVVSVGKKQNIRTAGVVHIETSNHPWPDKTFIPRVKEFDWTKAENTEEIPANHWIQVRTCDIAASTINSYFTRDGAKLTTKGYSTKRRAVLSRRPGMVSIIFENIEHTERLYLSDVAVTINNSGDPEDESFSPDGEFVYTETAFWLEPGEKRLFDIPDVDTSLAIHISSQTSAEGDSDIFPEIDIMYVEGIYGAPSLTQWGMIVLVLMLLAAGVVIIRRRRAISAA